MEQPFLYQTFIHDYQSMIVLRAFLSYDVKPDLERQIFKNTFILWKPSQSFGLQATDLK